MLNCWPHHSAPSSALQHGCPGSMDDPVNNAAIFTCSSFFLCPSIFFFCSSLALLSVFSVLLTEKSYGVLISSKCVNVYPLRAVASLTLWHLSASVSPVWICVYTAAAYHCSNGPLEPLCAIWGKCWRCYGVIQSEALGQSAAMVGWVVVRETSVDHKTS